MCRTARLTSTSALAAVATAGVLALTGCSGGGDGPLGALPEQDQERNGDAEEGGTGGDGALGWDGLRDLGVLPEPDDSPSAPAPTEDVPGLDDLPEAPDASEVPDLPDAPDPPGDGSFNTGEEISGIWEGADGTRMGIVSRQESETGLAQALYTDMVTEDICPGLLIDDVDTDGWRAFISCDESGDDFRWAGLSLDGEILSVTWEEDGSEVPHVFLEDWPDDAQRG